MRNFTLLTKVGFLSILLLCSGLSASAEGLKGTFFMKAAEFIEGAASAYDNTYLDGVEIVIAEADPETSWDLTVTNLCGQGVTYGGTVSEDGSTLTLGMLGNCYFSDRDYSGKGTESLGGADSTIMGSLVIELLEDGSLKFSDFTVINTVISGAPVSTALATYRGSVAVPVTNYHFKAANYTAGEASIYGNEYPAEFDFTLRRCIETDNYDVAVTNLCNQGTTFYATANEDNTELTISNVAYAYFSEKDYTKGTESLGGADGTMMGSIVMTLQDDGSLSFSDFTVIRTILPPPTFTVLATYVGGTAVGDEVNTPDGPSADETPTLTGTFFMKAAEFIEGAASAYDNTYLDGVEIVIAEADPETSWDLTVTNLCGQGVTYGGTVSEDGSTLTLGMLGNCYFSDRDYSGKGTESLGGADSTIMGSLVIELLEDGSLKFSDFTVINTVISGAPVSTALATYRGSVAVPVTNYHFKAANYTAGEASIYGNEYPAEFDFTLRRCIETDNYDVAVTNLCNQGTTFYATANEDNTELTISNVAYAYFSEKDYTKGTESLGGADGTMMGSIVMTLQDDGSWSFSDFTVIRTILPPPTFTVLATYVGGNATLSETTSVEYISDANNTELYSGEGFVAASNETAVLAVFDFSGRQVATGMGRIDNLASGIYIVQILCDDKSEVRKLFVE